MDPGGSELFNTDRQTNGSTQSHGKYLAKNQIRILPESLSEWIGKKQLPNFFTTQMSPRSAESPSPDPTQEVSHTQMAMGENPNRPSEHPIPSNQKSTAPARFC